MMRVETSFVDMSATQLTLFRASLMNKGEHITNERPHKTLSKGNELLVLLLRAAFFFLYVGCA